MANYTVPALTSTAAGAAAGSALGPLGAIGGGLVGLGSSIYQTWQTEEQAREMQQMIDQNYSKLLESINREYEKGRSGIGAVYSSGAKANKARTNQILGSQNLSGSPIAAALEREYGNVNAANAANQYNTLGQAKSTALLGAQQEYNAQNQQLGLAKQQGYQTNFNTALDALGKSGGAIGTIMSPNKSITGKYSVDQLNDLTLPEKINMGINTDKAVN